MRAREEVGKPKSRLPRAVRGLAMTVIRTGFRVKPGMTKERVRDDGLRNAEGGLDDEQSDGATLRDLGHEAAQVLP